MTILTDNYPGEITDLADSTGAIASGGPYVDAATTLVENFSAPVKDATP